MDFQLVLGYAPMDDQVEAIQALVGAIRQGSQHSKLLNSHSPEREGGKYQLMAIFWKLFYLCNPKIIIKGCMKVHICVTEECLKEK